MGYDPQFGARPLKRVIQQEVENRIARGILDGTIREGETLKIDAQDGKLVMEPVKAQAQEEAHAH
jgi:ATP-dependent Clp protease ATP-binding subunit ClpB